MRSWGGGGGGAGGGRAGGGGTYHLECSVEQQQRSDCFPLLLWLVLCGRREGYLLLLALGSEVLNKMLIQNEKNYIIR